MTSYDQIWKEFLVNCKTEDINLPKAQAKIYDCIHSAIRKYNNRIQDNLGWDDTTETVNRELTNDELLIITHMLRWAFLNNQLTFFVTSWQPFESDIGLKNFNTQVKGLEKLVKDQEAEIEKIITNSATDIM